MRRMPHPPTMIIDAHAHVFARDLPTAADARYVPAYDATPAQYLAQLDAHGVTAGVLVQPSFLGTDNGYLLQALARAPQRLRGVAVIEAAVGEADLARLHGAGVRAIRFNPFQRAVRCALSSPPWRSILARIAALGWHVVVHEAGEALVDLLEQLHGFAAPVVVDHLGRPGTDRRLNAAVEDAVLRRSAAGTVYVKLSAPYRGDAAATARAAAHYLQALGPQRLLWGSDWPWPNFEHRHDYAATLDWLTAIVAAPADRAALHAAAARLYGFASDAASETAT